MKKHFFPFVFIATALTVVLFQVNCTPHIDGPAPQAGRCNFSNMVAIGGDYMAGYQDGALSHDGQTHSIPSLLARQLRLVNPSYFAEYPLPAGTALGWNLKPWESWFTNAAHLGYGTDCQGVTSLLPLHDSLSRSNAFPIITAPGFAPSNVSVPFATLPQLFSPSLGNYNANQNTNPYYRMFARNPGVTTPIFEATNFHASFFAAWLGMEDIYNYAQSGGAGTAITSTSTFSTYLDSALTRLTVNGTEGVIANIPDFRNMPFFTLVPWNGATLTQSKADSLNVIYQTAGITNINFTAGANGFVIADASVPSGARQLHAGEYILLDAPLDSMKCDFYGILFQPLNDRYVLDSAEVANIDASIAAYNSIIASKAAQYDLALVDAYAYFPKVKSGIKWDGVDLNADFVTGGFFSLDGYHPNQKGYALLTNEFISAINAKYGATVPTLNCFDCNGVIFP